MISVTTRRWRVLATDVAVTAVAFVLASWLRWGSEWPDAWDVSLPNAATSLAFYAVGVGALYWYTGLGRRSFEWSVATDLRDLVRAMTLLGVLTLAALFAAKAPVSRLFLGYYVALTAAGIFASRLLAHAEARRARGSRQRLPLLIVGSGPAAKRFATQVVDHPELDVEVVGFVDDDLGSLNGYPRLGSTSDLAKVLSEHVISDVAICVSDWSSVDELVAVSQEQGKNTHVPLSGMAYSFTHGRVERLGETTVLSLTKSPHRPLALAAKRVIDVIGSVFLLLLTAPVSLAATAMIGLTDGRPVLFRQQRAGLHGQPFTILKFRTMDRDAEDAKAALVDRNERQGHAFKITGDPRVTRIGGFLRRTSIDELPQLINVLKGDMSLVGPRPPEVAEVRGYDAWHRRRLSMRPGITGLWQVTARHEPDFDRWVELDLQYIDTWSLASDLLIFLKTPLALLKTPGR